MQLQTRDRRALGIAAFAVVAGLAFRFGAIPYIAKHAELRAELQMQRDLYAREAGLIEGVELIDTAVRQSADYLTRNANRVFVADLDANLTASEVQSYVDRIVHIAGVTVSQMDVQAADSLNRGLSRVGLRVRGQGDFEGVMALLDAVQTGPRLLEIQELSVQPPPGASTLSGFDYQALDYAIRVDAFVVRGR
jgi:type II secretion system (T2SS) protein M